MASRRSARIAAAAESASEHPLAEAIVTAAFERNVVPPEVVSFEAVPGKGVVGRSGGEDLLVGSPRFLGERGIDLQPVADRIAELEADGRTVIVVARGRHSARPARPARHVEGRCS